MGVERLRRGDAVDEVRRASEEGELEEAEVHVLVVDLAHPRLVPAGGMAALVLARLELAHVARGARGVATDHRLHLRVERGARLLDDLRRAEHPIDSVAVHVAPRARVAEVVTDVAEVLRALTAHGEDLLLEDAEVVFGEDVAVAVSETAEVIGLHVRDPHRRAPDRGLERLERRLRVGRATLDLLWSRSSSVGVVVAASGSEQDGNGESSQGGETEPAKEDAHRSPFVEERARVRLLSRSGKVPSRLVPRLLEARRFHCFGEVLDVWGHVVWRSYAGSFARCPSPRSLPRRRAGDQSSCESWLVSGATGSAARAAATASAGQDSRAAAAAPGGPWRARPRRGASRAPGGAGRSCRR